MYNRGELVEDITKIIVNTRYTLLKEYFPKLLFFSMTVQMEYSCMFSSNYSYIICRCGNELSAKLVQSWHIANRNVVRDGRTKTTFYSLFDGLLNISSIYIGKNKELTCNYFTHFRDIPSVLIKSYSSHYIILH